MKNEIMVSVICAAFNHEPFIAQALDSFVKQKTTFSYEVIVNDDASTDGTAEIIRKYQEMYPGIIKPIYQEHNQYSLGNSVNSIMVDASKGKYLAFCEGDDYWTDENKLQKQVEYLENNPDCSLCAHANDVVDTDGTLIRTRCDCKPNSIVNLITDGGYIHTSTKVMRRDVFTTFPNALKKKYYGGVCSIYYAHTLGHIYFIGDSMSAWRINANSVTHTLYKSYEKDLAIFEDYINFYNRFDTYTEFKYKTSLDKRCAEQISSLVIKDRKLLTKDYFRKLFDTRGYYLCSLKMKVYIFLRAKIQFW